MTDWTSRELEIDFSFLPAGNFWMEAYQDGANAHRNVSDYKKVKSQVNKTAKVSGGTRWRLDSENTWPAFCAQLCPEAGAQASVINKLDNLGYSVPE